MRHYVFLRRLDEKSVWGGCENRLLRYFSNVDHSAFKITLVTSRDIFSAKFKEHNIPVRVVECPFKYSQATVAQFRTFLQSLSPDRVVFVQGAFTDFMFKEFLAGFLTAPGHVYAIEVLGAPEPFKAGAKDTPKRFIAGGLWWYSKMIQLCLRGWLCKRILTVSNEVKTRLVKWYCYPQGRIVNVFAGVNLSRFLFNETMRQAKRRELHIPENATVIISTARLAVEKRIDRLINAFDDLAEINKNIWLIIVGGGPLNAELMELTAKKKHKNRICFVGLVDNVNDYLTMSDIFVLPSDIEGVATALLEAMATNVLSLATRTPGPSEIITDGVNGLFIEKSAKGVYEGLVKALSLPERTKANIRINAREYIEKNFEFHEIIHKALKRLDLR